MPNWCSNSLYMTGPTATIKAVWDKVKDDRGLLEAMVPLGEWEYDKAVNAWGTKWDIDTTGLEYSEDGDRATIRGGFLSAWSPPVEAFQTYCDANPDVEVSLTYFEPGISFVGQWDTKSGEETYKIDPSNLDAIPQDLREDWDIDSYYEQETEETKA